LTVIEIEHPSKALAPTHGLRWRDGQGRLHESVLETLVISLAVIVCHEMRDSVLKRCPSEEDHSVQALGFYRAHEALGESVTARQQLLAVLTLKRFVSRSRIPFTRNVARALFC
jgi:hypothetical protein